MRKSKTLKAFPDESVLVSIRERLSDPKFEGENFALPADASETERAKYQICQLIARFKRENSLLQRDLAKELGINESRVSDILRGKIESFTLDRLLSYAEQLHPKLKIIILAA